MIVLEFSGRAEHNISFSNPIGKNRLRARLFVKVKVHYFNAEKL